MYVVRKESLEYISYLQLPSSPRCYKYIYSLPSDRAAMGEKAAPSRRVLPCATPEEDPKSELNIQRREVRQSQAAVRDANLEVASKQEEALSLRIARTAMQVEVNDGLALEANLRTQLQVQRVKRQRVKATLAAVLS